MKNFYHVAFSLYNPDYIHQHSSLAWTTALGLPDVLNMNILPMVGIACEMVALTAVMYSAPQRPRVILIRTPVLRALKRRVATLYFYLFSYWRSHGVDSQ